MIEAHAFFGRDGKPQPPPVSRRWSFYTALLFPSSNYAPEVQVRHRLKSYVRDAVHNVGKWRAMADACVWKGTVVTAVRSAD